MKITDIADSKYNHSNSPEIICTVTVEHEIALKPEDIMKVLCALHSDSMAKVINHIGESFNKDQFAECYAVSDLNEHGKQFILDMAYFINSELPPGC